MYYSVSYMFSQKATLKYKCNSLPFLHLFSQNNFLSSSHDSSYGLPKKFIAQCGLWDTELVRDLPLRHAIRYSLKSCLKSFFEVFLPLGFGRCVPPDQETFLQDFVGAIVLIRSFRRSVHISMKLKKSFAFLYIFFNTI